MKTRAILIERHGPPGVLVEREVDLPDPGPGQVHLQVEAAGVNFADLVMRAGLYSTVPPRPYSPGFEVAGRVRRVGSGVSNWQEGDRAVALMRFGGYRRDVLLDADQLFPWPGDLSAAEAATLPVAFLTAWVCLFGVGHAQPEESVLVLGAAGGVGTAAVQLARRHGMTVYGTAGSARKRDFVVEKLGAKACYDSTGRWDKQLEAAVGERPLDVALDPVGGDATKACRRLLAPLGRLVFYGMSAAVPGDRRNWARAAWAWLRTGRIHPLNLVEPCIGIAGVHLLHLGKKEGILRRGYDDVCQAVKAAEIFPVLDRSFPLTRDGAAEAHGYVHERRVLGRVALVSPEI